MTNRNQQNETEEQRRDREYDEARARDAEFRQQMRRELEAAAGSDRILSARELARYALSTESWHRGTNTHLSTEAVGSAIHMQAAIDSGLQWILFGDYNNQDQAEYARIAAEIVIEEASRALNGSRVRYSGGAEQLAIELARVYTAQVRGDEQGVMSPAP